MDISGPSGASGLENQQCLVPPRALGVIKMSQWQSAKSLIRQLYVVENKPYKFVAELLRQKYGFYPTKRQFERKVRVEWRMEKYNTKAKWPRLETKEQNARGFPGSAEAISSTSIATSTNDQRRLLAPKPNSVDGSSGALLDSQTIWNYSNIVKSPSLEALFNAFEVCGIGASREIPSLFLPPSSSISAKRKQYLSDNDIRDLYNPFKEIDPFPNYHNISTNTRHSNRITPEGSHIEYEDRLRKLERVLPATNDGVVSLMEQLLSIYDDWGNNKKSLTLIQRICVSKEKIYGAKSPTYLSTRIKLHWTLAQFSFKRAMLCHAALHNDVLHTFSDDHDLVLQSTVLMAYLHQQLGEPAAEDLARQALQMHLNKFGPKHAQTLEIMAVLATTLVQNGAFEPGEGLLRITIQLLPQIEGFRKHELLFNMRGLSRIFEYEDRTDEAVSLSRQTLTFSKSMYDKGHPEILSTTASLGISLNRHGQTEEGKHLLKTVIPRMKEKVGDDDPNTLWVIDELAWQLRVEGKYAEAAKYYQEVFEGNIQCLGVEHSETVAACIDLGQVYRKQGLRHKAFSLYEKTIIDIRAICPEGNSGVEKIQSNIDSLYRP